MQAYQYKARDKYGKLVEGVMAADTKEAVALKLDQSGLIPINVLPARSEKQLGRVFFQWRSLRISELNMFTRQLFTLQKAGLPLMRSLHTLREQADNPALKDIIGQIEREIEAGSSLSSALERHPRVFNDLYVNMVKSGEVSGKLPEVLERLAILGEYEEKVILKIKTATRYPIIVVAAIIIGFIILITLVVPRFAKLYSQHAAALPIPTQILITVHAVITQFWWAFIIAAAVAVLLFRRLIKNSSGRFWWDHFKLNMPIFGTIILNLSMSRFCRITGTLMHSGVPILQILDLVSGSLDNAVISKVISDIKNSVNEGKGMYEPMTRSGLFPPLVTQMISVGEETGKIDELLIHAADYYDAQTEFAVTNLISLIEPILIFILGISVLFMALAIYLPMWNMMNLFKP